MTDGYTRIGIDLEDLRGGPIDSEIVMLRWDQLSGVFLDFVLAKLEAFPAIELTYRIGLQPERVRIGPDFDHLQHWSPVRDSAQADALSRKYLGRELSQDQSRIDILQNIVRHGIGEEIELRRPRHRNA